MPDFYGGMAFGLLIGALIMLIVAESALEEAHRLFLEVEKARNGSERSETA